MLDRLLMTNSFTSQSVRDSKFGVINVVMMEENIRFESSKSISSEISDGIAMGSGTCQDLIISPSIQRLLN